MKYYPNLLHVNTNLVLLFLSTFEVCHLPTHRNTPRWRAKNTEQLHQILFLTNIPSGAAVRAIIVLGATIVSFTCAGNNCAKSTNMHTTVQRS
jgi:hypothetical protein